MCRWFRLSEYLLSVLGQVGTVGLVFLNEKNSMILPRLILPLFCCVYFLYPFQLLWRLGRSSWKKKAGSEKDQSQSEASKALSLIGLDRDMILILPWAGMGIINISWYQYHFWYSLTIQVFIDTTIDTFLLIGGNTKHL